MRRLQRRKVFKILFLSLVVSGLTVSSVLFSSVPSYAALPDDAAVSFNTKVPVGYRSFLMPTQSPAALAIWYQMDQSLSLQNGSSASYLWRLTQNFNLSNSYVWTSSAQALTTWYYDSSLDFELGKVYQFNINIRYSNYLGESNNLNFDFSKLLLVFTRFQFPLNTDLSKSDMVSYLYSGFAPAANPSISGNYVQLTYNVPITPDSFFFDQAIEVDSTTGLSYVSIPGMGLYDSGTGAAAMYTSNGSLNGIQMAIFPYNTSSARVFTPSEWSDHVVEQGFNDLSSQINLSTLAIQGSIDDAADSINNQIDSSAHDVADAILNAGDPIDISDMEDLHDVEHDMISGISSTLPYYSGISSSINTKLPALIAQIGPGLNLVNNWFDTTVEVIGPIGLIVFLTVMFTYVFIVFKGVF